MNHLMYVVDICLMAPTAMAMQQLSNICNDYGVANDITYNLLSQSALFLGLQSISCSVHVCILVMPN